MTVYQRQWVTSNGPMTAATNGVTALPSQAANTVYVTTANATQQVQPVGMMLAATMYPTAQQPPRTWFGRHLRGGGIQPNLGAYGASLHPIEGDVDDNGTLRLPQGWCGEIRFEDGGRLFVAGGQYRIEDKDAKVTYQANRVRPFNRFLNAGDLLQDFIADLGKAGARQSEILSVPIELFINWIILKAAEQDQDKPAAMLRPRCRWCGRYIASARLRAGIAFCGEAHAVSFMRRAALA